MSGFYNELANWMEAMLLITKYIIMRVKKGVDYS